MQGVFRGPVLLSRARMRHITAEPTWSVPWGEKCALH